MEDRKYFIAIAGNIGVGKTTLTELISKHFGWKAYYEQVINNPYLDDFYKDMNRWSFHLQIYFLSNRFKSHKEMIERNESCVQDRTIYEDVEIFARTLYEQGSMSQRDYENYSELFSIMTSYLKKPDLILYLKASIDTLMARIKKRGRESEKSITSEYLYRLNRAYEKWIDKAKTYTNVKIIDTEKFEIGRDHDKVNELLEQIQMWCREIK
jgi:deoxyadenosine/deoxycytidine kinase